MYEIEHLLTGIRFYICMTAFNNKPVKIPSLSTNFLVYDVPKGLGCVKIPPPVTEYHQIKRSIEDYQAKQCSLTLPTLREFSSWSSSKKTNLVTWFIEQIVNHDQITNLNENITVKAGDYLL